MKGLVEFMPVEAEIRTHAARRGGFLSRQRMLALVLLAATALGLYVCYRIALPFFPALAWATALAVVAHPVHDWLFARLRKPNLAALVAVMLVAVLLVGPLVLVTQALLSEAQSGLQKIQQHLQSGEWRRVFADHPRLKTIVDWSWRNLDAGAEAKQAAGYVADRAQSMLTGSAWAMLQLALALFTLFFLFRDRREALKGVRSLVPLSNREADAVLARVADTIHATIYGTLVVSAIQGILGGLMFWILGLPGPLLWGLMMSLLAVIPSAGAFLIWLPAAVIVAVQGHWAKALILAGWGATAVSLIDNLLYPILVGQRLRMHTLLVFFAILGGVFLFGASGIILGPVSFALTLALVDIWRRRTAGGRAAEASVQE
jgi:predicted PurR-regulated permease PerM